MWDCGLTLSNCCFHPQVELFRILLFFSLEIVVELIIFQPLNGAYCWAFTWAVLNWWPAASSDNISFFPTFSQLSTFHFWVEIFFLLSLWKRGMLIDWFELSIKKKKFTCRAQTLQFIARYQAQNQRPYVRGRAAAVSLWIVYASSFPPSLLYSDFKMWINEEKGGWFPLVICSLILCWLGGLWWRNVENWCHHN